MTTAERVLLSAATAVLVAGVVAALTVGSDDEGAPTAVPRPSGSPSPSPSPEPTPTGPAVAGVRIVSYARGSHSVVVTVHVTGASGAALEDGDRTVPLRVVGATASGTVPVDCAAPVPRWVLRLTAADGTDTTVPVPSPARAFAEACASPLPAGPLPTATRGS